MQTLAMLKNAKSGGCEATQHGPSAQTTGVHNLLLIFLLNLREHLNVTTRWASNIIHLWECGYIEHPCIIGDCSTL